MPIQYPTEVKLPGPWLLDDEALEQLDKIVDEEWKRLEARRRALIEGEANEKLSILRNSSSWEKDSEREQQRLDYYINNPSYNLSQNKKSINLFLENEAIYITDNFSSAQRDNALLNEVVTGFSLDLESADIRCSSSLYGWSKELRINVSPGDSNEARGIFVAINNWADKFSPPLWQRIWEKISEWNWIAWLLILLLCVTVWVNSNSLSTIDAKNRAKVLLDGGISQENSLEAIKLLLIIQSDYDPTNTTINREVPTWLELIIVIGLVLNIILSIKAKTILGIGKGRKLISRWRVWYKLVGITIPGLIFGSIIWPIIVEGFDRWIK